MFSRLSIVARFALVQVVLIFLAIGFAGTFLKLSGRSKEFSDDFRANIASEFKPAPLSEWLRSHGWTLLGLPSATMVAAAWARGRGFSEDNLEWISAFTAVALVGLAFIGGLQAFERKNGIFMRVRAVPATPSPADSKIPSPPE